MHVWLFNELYGLANSSFAAKEVAMSIKFGVLAYPLARRLTNRIFLIEIFKYAVINACEK